MANQARDVSFELTKTEAVLLDPTDEILEIVSIYNTGPLRLAEQLHEQLFKHPLSRVEMHSFSITSCNIE